MRLLAIDTSERYFSIAILDSGTLVAQISSRDAPNRDQTELDCKLKAGQMSPSASKPAASLSPGVAVRLFPMMQALFKRTGLSVNEIELLAVATGPGMFTGLRSGVVAAKTLAYGLGVPLVAVNTLEVLAWQAAQEINKDRAFASMNLRVLPVVNAQRQQLFAGFYQVNRDRSLSTENCQGDKSPFGSFELKQISDDKIMDRAAWLNSLESGDWVTGTGLIPLIENPLLAQTNGVAIVTQESWPVQASAVGAIAWRDFLLGRRDNMWTLEPFYFRPSYAEE